MKRKQQDHALIVICTAGKHDHPTVHDAALREIEADAATDKRRILWNTFTSTLLTDGEIESESGHDKIVLGDAVHAVKFTWSTEPMP